MQQKRHSQTLSRLALFAFSLVINIGVQAGLNSLGFNVIIATILAICIAVPFTLISGHFMRQRNEGGTRTLAHDLAYLGFQHRAPVDDTTGRYWYAKDYVHLTFLEPNEHKVKCPAGRFKAWCSYGYNESNLGLTTVRESTLEEHHGGYVSKRLISENQSFTERNRIIPLTRALTWRAIREERRYYKHHDLGVNEAGWSLGAYLFSITDTEYALDNRQLRAKLVEKALLFFEHNHTLEGAYQLRHFDVNDLATVIELPSSWAVEVLVGTP